MQQDQHTRVGLGILCGQSEDVRTSHTASSDVVMEQFLSYGTKPDPRIREVAKLLRERAPSSMTDEALQVRAKQVLRLYEQLVKKPPRDERKAT